MNCAHNSVTTAFNTTTTPDQQLLVVASYLIQMYRLSQLVARSASRVVNAKSTPRWGGTVTIIDPSYDTVDPFIFLVHHGLYTPPQTYATILPQSKDHKHVTRLQNAQTNSTCLHSRSSNNKIGTRFKGTNHP